jgi:simple sugar transport system permease protein
MKPLLRNDGTLVNDRSNILNSSVVRVLICIFAPVIVFGILLMTEGRSVTETYVTIINSIFGTSYGFGEVIVRTEYLILTSLAAILPNRVGLANAGGEGQMAVGGLFTAVAGSTFLRLIVRPVGLPLMLIRGMAAGMVWASMAIFCKMKLGMNETLTTILMNYISTYFISMLLFGVLRDPLGWNYPQTVEVASQLRLKLLFGTRMNDGIIIAVVVALLVWYVLKKTRVGFLIRTIGGNQLAARYSGISVKRVQTFTFLAAGALAGLAGAILIIGVEGRMRVDAGATMGFMGFLAAGIVKNDPILAIFSAFLIAALNVAGNAMEINTNLPAASIQILIMLVLLTIMTVGGKRKYE